MTARPAGSSSSMSTLAMTRASIMYWPITRATYRAAAQPLWAIELSGVVGSGCSR
jgi:hypothetical protein